MIEQLMLAAIFVVGVKGGTPTNTATAFFYNTGSEIVLVTNRHVVVDPHPDAVVLPMHVDAGGLTKNVDVRIPLYDDKGKPRFRVHKDYATNKADIAVIDIDPKLLQGKVFKALSKDLFVPDDLLVGTGDRAIVVGCPYTVRDVKHNLPIACSGMIASSYNVDFNGSRAFLLDANLHEGTSGSPVVTEPSTLISSKKGDTMLTNAPRFFFIGIHSATLNFAAKAGDKPEPLGLSQVWRAQLIEEIVEGGMR